ncbi:diaminopimelate decarboxylase [hydrocarbon metagenome]|uniref:Diaminopimelate decarboxylase n=1 Tax=hydrocarbon metagenome TaxID=938273 RepID=A0A0W8G1K8_9ZZZZ
MAKKYEKPIIIKVQTGMMNKFGSSPYYSRKIRTEIDGVAISELVDKFDSPLFVFSEKSLRQKYRAYYNSFSTRYPNITFGWSYKTNYLPAICSVFHQEGAIAEVVSEMEYDKARSLGIPGNKIIYNGPYKNLHALEKAVKEGSLINIDHFDEIYDLEKVADKLNKKIKVGMRVNMDTGIYPQWSRFGLSLDSGQAMDAVKRMVSKGKLVLNGLHCHIGTFILDPNAYAVEIEKMIKFGYEIQDKFNMKIDYYDIGGGFPSKSKLKGTYQEPDVMIPSIDEYAESITTSLFRNLKPGDLPKVYLETGRAIVDEAGYLITTVIASKRLPDGRKSYIADAGINLLYTAFWYKYNIETDRQVDGTNEPAIVNGPLCMNIDVIEEGTLLPPMEKGTRLILSPVGAYNVTQWMQFIEYRPNVVLIGENKELDIIREAEDLSDITRREKLPERLKLKE